MSTQYTRDYFIARFEAIPEELWITDYYNGPAGSNTHCAIGHLRDDDGDGEANALRGLLSHIPNDKTDSGGHGPAIINDGKSSRYQQPTPKQRILAALRDLPA